MKAATPALQALLASQVHTLATCWRAVRRDGAAFAFTDHDADLLLGGETYRSTLGFKRTAISQSSLLNVDDTEIAGILDAATITDHDVRAGLWDYCEFRVFLCDWRAPDAGQLRLRRGWLGECVRTDRGGFTAELRSLTTRLAQKVGELTTPECRAQFGDSRCKVDLALWTFPGVVGAVAGDAPRAIFTVPAVGPPSAGSFVGGIARFTGGLNAGFMREMLDYDPETRSVGLFLPVPYTIAPGDAVELVAGCPKRLEDCIAFDNIANMRAEPYVPGMDTLARVAVPGP